MTKKANNKPAFAKPSAGRQTEPRLRQGYVGQVGEIPEDWDIHQIQDVVDINPKRLLSKGRRYKKVAMSDLKEGERQIVSYNYDNYRGGSRFKNDDTLLARITPCLENGKTAFVNFLNKKEVAFGSTEFIVLAPKDKFSDPKFLYYFARSPKFRDTAIKSMVGSSGRQRVQTDVIAQKRFAIPNLSEQTRIASILSSLDDKIELNCKMNKTLEEIGKALFKRWFMDFEFPCLLTYGERMQAKHPELMVYGYKSFGGLPAPQSKKAFIYVLELENGHHYIGMTNFLLLRYHKHILGEGALYTKQHKVKKLIHWEEFETKKEAAAREKWLKTGFGRKWIKRNKKAGRLRQAGGKMVESELGEIPEGWEVKKLGDLVDIIMGQSPKSKFYNENKKGLPFHQGVKDFGNRFPEDNTYSTEGNKIALKGDILFSVRAPVARINVAKNKVILGRGLAALRMKQFSNNFLLYYLLNRFKKPDTFGEGTVYKSVSKKDLEELEIIFPIEQILDPFNRFVETIDNCTLNNYLNINTLSKIRDLLLPRLMSGRLRV